MDKKLLQKIISGQGKANINFNKLCKLIANLGFDERIEGDHHIFTKEGVEEIINIQPKKGKAKPYQVSQIRDIIKKYKLGE